MAKSDERNAAIELRQQGRSMKEIAKTLHVSKSSVSLWCRDILLSPSQIKVLHESMVRGSYAGRMTGSTMQHEKRLKRQEDAERASLQEIGKLSRRDMVIALAALYWGEGSKKNRVLFINNSDPGMVKFLIQSFKSIFNVQNEDFVLAVGLNVAHNKREKEIREYWSKITGIPQEQFRKTIFIKTQNKKKYNNFGNHYGTLRINVKKSIDIYYRMMGLIKALQMGV